MASAVARMTTKPSTAVAGAPMIRADAVSVRAPAAVIPVETCGARFEPAENAATAGTKIAAPSCRVDSRPPLTDSRASGYSIGHFRMSNTIIPIHATATTARVIVMASPRSCSPGLGFTPNKVMPRATRPPVRRAWMPQK